MALSILAFGAHPDDAEFHAGGLLARHAQAGNTIHLVSVSDGSAGHHRLGRKALAARRRDEAAAAAAVIGAEVDVWPYPDGELEPSLELRRAVIRTVRRHRPDLVLTHRIHDYHPDHRAVATLVRDACYMVRVPNVVPDAPALTDDPIVAHFADFFSLPTPFRADVVVDVEGVLETAMAMLDRHASQVYEWIPHTLGRSAEVPVDPAERRRWLPAFYGLSRAVARRFAPALRHAEAFEISEYGRKPTEAELDALFFRTGAASPQTATGRGG
jgi:LmbE family N-acetylglucosaminyl deacetylase